VLVVWECEIEKDPDAACSRAVGFLDNATQGN
jgi:hypothetical protein